MAQVVAPSNLIRVEVRVPAGGAELVDGAAQGGVGATVVQHVEVPMKIVQKSKETD